MTHDIFGSIGATARSQIVPFRSSGAGSPLFCFPGSGGNPKIFREMVAALPEGQPVYAIDMEWLCETNEDFSIEQLAAFYLDAIRKIQKSGPYYLCGYSFGGLVAYELSMRLIDEGDRASLVALLDAPNPALISNLSGADSMQFRKAYLTDRLKKCDLNLVQCDYRGIHGQGARFHRLPGWKVLHARNQDRVSNGKKAVAREFACQRSGVLESVELVHSKALSGGRSVFSGARSRAGT